MVGVGDGTEVAGGSVGGVVLGEELPVVVAGDAPQPARKHRLKTTATGTERGFTRSLHFFPAC